MSRHQASLKRKTTANQARASAGKRLRQAQKKQTYEQRAAALGKTVAELKMIEARESVAASALQRAQAQFEGSSFIRVGRGRPRFY